MELNSAFLRAMLRETLSDPQAAARKLMDMNPPMEARWLGLAVVVVLSVLLGQASVLMMATEDTAFVMGGGASAIVQGAALLMVVYSAHMVGRLFGGAGSFADAVLLVSWLQFMMVVLQVIQVAALFLVPPLSGMIGIIAITLFLWVLTNFVAVLHGFQSLGKVFGMILVTFMAIAFVVAFLLALLGVQGPGMVDA